MSSSPIFDQLIVEFAQERDIHFPRLINAYDILTKEIPETPDKNDVTKNTLFDATHLKVIRPAIPEFDKTVKMEKVQADAGLKTDDVDFTEAIAEADRDLGVKAEDKETQVFDESFREAVKALTPPQELTAVITTDEVLTKQEFEDLKDEALHVTPILRGNVTAIRRTNLPRRKNKRGNKKTTENSFSFFATDTTSSPGSAA